MPQKKPYNVLRISTLSRTWHDKDEIMLHACFQILVDFIEDECSPGVVNWAYDARHRKTKKELDFLYKWWKEIRPARFDPFLDDDSLVRPTGKELLGPPNEKGHRKWMGGSAELKKKYPKYYKAMEQSWKLEEKWIKEDQEMLHRLIDVRREMWT